jgi:hypothetical protein
MATCSLLMAQTTVLNAVAVSHLARAPRRGIFHPHSLLVLSSLVLIASHACTLSQSVASSWAMPPTPRHVLLPAPTRSFISRIGRVQH